MGYLYFGVVYTWKTDLEFFSALNLLQACCGPEVSPFVSNNSPFFRTVLSVDLPQMSPYI